MHELSGCMDVCVCVRGRLAWCKQIWSGVSEWCNGRRAARFFLKQFLVALLQPLRFLRANLPWR